MQSSFPQILTKPNQKTDFKDDLISQLWTKLSLFQYFEIVNFFDRIIRADSKALGWFFV